jgi:hypothetical protein
MSLNQQFRKAVSSSLDTLSIEDLKPFALALWHEGYVPELDELNEVELQKAGYLIDRLMRYNCISKEHKLKLSKLVKSLKQKLSTQLETNSSLVNQGVDPLARKWNLSEDVSSLISPLLEYQTRHYVHV